MGAPVMIRSASRGPMPLGWTAPAGKVADDAKTRLTPGIEVRGADGEAVDGGVVRRRDVEGSCDVPGQDAPETSRDGSDSSCVAPATSAKMRARASATGIMVAPVLYRALCYSGATDGRRARVDRDRAADGRGHARCGSAWRSVGRAHGETRPTRFLVESAGDVIPAGVLRRGRARRGPRAGRRPGTDRLGARGRTRRPRPSFHLVAQAFGLTWLSVVPAAYFVLGHGTAGRTVGKRLLGARRRRAGGADRIRPRARSVPGHRAGPAPVRPRPRSGGAAPDRRGLHDLLAGTRVVSGR